MKAHTQINLDLFCKTLALEYQELFKTPEYAFPASRTTPEAMAKKMTLGLDNGTANKDGGGVIRTCKKLGIAHTFKAIRVFLAEK